MNHYTYKELEDLFYEFLMLDAPLPLNAKKQIYFLLQQTTKNNAQK